jgi:hypothetical protein
MRCFDRRDKETAQRFQGAKKRAAVGGVRPAMRVCAHTILLYAVCPYPLFMNNFYLLKKFFNTLIYSCRYLISVR